MSSCMLQFNSMIHSHTLVVLGDDDGGMEEGGTVRRGVQDWLWEWRYDDGVGEAGGWLRSWKQISFPLLACNHGSGAQHSSVLNWYQLTVIIKHAHVPVSTRLQLHGKLCTARGHCYPVQKTILTSSIRSEAWSHGAQSVESHCNRTNWQLVNTCPGNSD